MIKQLFDGLKELEVNGIAGQIIQHSECIGCRLQIALAINKGHRPLVFDESIHSLESKLEEVFGCPVEIHISELEVK